MVKQREKLHFVKCQKTGQHVFDPPYANEVSERDSSICGGLELDTF